ncbi:GNAT family N-acetyltransferase [Luteimicrobium sp. NPDC057192]|uniref:GNAT family N-acetyltransferase n=1 Tax=Luteimicrobium sp. NPDC057192 TaxID=3346042 RepID=UPI0036396592
MPTTIPESLTDGEIRLRPWRDEDADAQLAGFADPVFRRFSDGVPLDRADVVKRIRAVERQRAEGTAAYWAIDDAHDGRLLGEVSLSGIDHRQGRASVGYWLTASARGRGVATRAVRLAARSAFTDLGLARLELTCAPDNAASQAVAERSGFRREGLLRAHLPFKGGRRDSLVYGLLPEDLAR